MGECSAPRLDVAIPVLVAALSETVILPDVAPLLGPIWEAPQTVMPPRGFAPRTLVVADEIDDEGPDYDYDGGGECVLSAPGLEAANHVVVAAMPVAGALPAAAPTSGASWEASAVAAHSPSVASTAPVVAVMHAGAPAPRLQRRCERTTLGERATLG